ncbi:MAG: metallophosphoesterase, partial [Chloroflexota bacterium]
MSIPSLLPKNEAGHQFVIYADCCSGVAGAPHEATFASINQVVQQLTPQPEFICFPGDEIIGLTANEKELRAQWQYWFETEMAWLDRDKIPLYHTTGNHTTYDPMSERVYQEVMAHLPQNGPDHQKGLSYFVRRGNLLMIFIHTLWSGAGGEGYVEHEWLEATLQQHADATHKLVFGHHPVHPVNGFSGEFQREVGPDYGRILWNIFVKHRVFAYVCSHILAFDVQVHDGVLQLLTAGAGTRYRMPEGIEYLHAVQAALDEDGLRYQVLDVNGRVREKLHWPFRLPNAQTWQPFPNKFSPAKNNDLIVGLSISGQATDDKLGHPQTLLCGWENQDTLPTFWLGLRGAEQRLSLLISPEPGRSPHLWLGPVVRKKRPFAIQIAIHMGMGPGGMLWRWDDNSP